jgi:CRISPR type III-B/RAMP module RAMP protein Cmr1
MPKPIVVKLQPLTPLWTGDAEQCGNQIRETGILGSLRWWYEALIRGLGLYACDPSSGSCVYDEKKRKLASICFACQLFGCTGYSRRFRLAVSGGGSAGQLTEVKLQNPGTSNHRGWRIPRNVCVPLTLAVHPLRPDALDDFEHAAIRYTLHLVERYGALGAKTSHGQGVVKIAGWGTLPAVMETDTWIGGVKARPAKEDTNPQPAPDLSEFIGATITLDAATTSRANWWTTIPLTGLDSFSLGSNPNWVPSAPAIRAQLRGWLRNSANFQNFNGNLQDERHRLMGSIRAPVGPRGSDIFVTHLYKAGERWSMRIFAFVPRGGNAVDQGVRQLLSDQARLESEVAIGLGGLNVQAEPYPATVRALLGVGSAISE